MGDSLCKGVVLDEDRRKYYFANDCFVNRVQQSIRPSLYNASKFGSTIAYGRQNLEKNLQKHQPDVVFVEFGGNDCDYAWDEIAKNPFYDHIPHTPLNEFEQIMQQMIDTIQDANALPVLMTLPPLNALNFFKWFTNGDAEKGKNILKWLDDVWRIYWWQERYSSAIKAIAEQQELHCIDVRQAFLKKLDFRKFICLDGIHPNILGHELIASEILKYITDRAKELLCVPQPLPALSEV
jgi:lysophospholipase L1-like esterase